MKTTLKNSFYQLIGIYTLVILLISLGLFWKYSFQFHFLGLIIGILGITIISKKEELKLNKKLHYSLLTFGLLLTFIVRFIPYLNNKIPLGYDAGIYKYGIEFGLKNLDNWILRGGLEPGFLYLISFLKLFLTSQFILTYLLILFTVLLGFIIYLTTKEFYSKEAGLISLFIYCFSIIQFKAFWYMYYKNIIGMCLALLAIYFLKKDKRVLFILTGGILGSIHRPTFYIFGLSYLVYTILQTKKLKYNIINGVLILATASVFYLGKFKDSILIMFEPVLEGFIQTGESPGTFINFFTFEFAILAYLPFAVIGLIYFIKKRDFNMITIWSILSFIIVYFQFFFFNRFIIMLDLVLIILSGIGFSILLQNKFKFKKIIVLVLILSLGILAFQESINSRPLINENELNTIKQLQNTEEEAFVMATSSNYSPWVLGYSERKTIAPGLFDYNEHDEQKWIEFWTAKDLTTIRSFMDAYEKPLYIFIGEKQKDNLEQFSECFTIYYQLESNKIYKYTC